MLPSMLVSSTFFLSVIFITSSAALILPEGMKLVQGQFSLPRTWKQLSDEKLPDRIMQVVRTRRGVKYHVASIPRDGTVVELDAKENPIEVDQRHFVKRHTSKFNNVDDSAQYTEDYVIDQVNPRNKRQVIEEQDIKNGKPSDQIEIVNTPKPEQWIPQGGTEQHDLFEEKKSEPKVAEASPADAITAEALTDKQNGRGVRGATKDQWIKLPFLARPLDNDQLSSSSPNLEDYNHRMPRVNFVTQGKGLQTAESRNQRESVPRGSYSRSSDLRTDIYPPDRDGRARSLDYSTYSRRSYYYPDDYRRPSYDDYGYDDGYSSRRDPYYDRSDYKNGRRYDYSDYSRYRDPYDRYDGYEDNYRYDKPRRIIYYANLPDVVRTPPNVYRYSSNPYNRYDDDRYSNRDSRYNDYYRGSGSYPYSRYPYSALKKSENEGPRDLTTSSTVSKEKSENLKRQQEQANRKSNDDSSRSRDSNLNSHQYPVSLGTSMNVDSTSKSPHQTLYHDITRMDSDFHRYDHPSFQAAVDDPYISRHD